MRSIFDLALLEARLLYCVDNGFGVDIGTYPPHMGPSLLFAAGPTTSTGAAIGSVAVSGGVPSLSSNPTATAKLFIDFNGAAAQGWGSFSVPATVAFDQDSDVSSFSDGEIASIKEIWARVAEKYSSFNIDVTTIDPGSYPLGKVMRVVVGGAGAWTGASYGGISYVGSFTSGPNTSWVFTQNLGGGAPTYTAEAIAHEAGHAFGLQHQSSYDLSSAKTAEYSTGNGVTAPIMGNSYYATRGIWWNGSSSLGAASLQDDMARISASTNGFGYRADDHGNTMSVADGLLVSGDSVSGSGRIERSSDLDFFKFATAGGSISLSANVLATGATLDLKLALYSSFGALVATADTGSLGESIVTNLAPGTYYLSVMSEGNYGDVGQYTVTGSVPAPAGLVAAPTNLIGATLSSQISLSWTDNSMTESGFHVQRSSDGGVTWIEVATVGADVVSFQDALPAVGASSQYRVYAFDALTTSNFTNAVTLWGPPAPPPVVLAKPPAAPSGLVATRIAKGKIKLTWLDNSTNETGFRIEYSKNGGATWSLLTTVGAGIKAYTASGLSRGTVYSFRVCACSAAGNSAYCVTAQAAAANPLSLSMLKNGSFSEARIAFACDDVPLFKSKHGKVFKAA